MLRIFSHKSLVSIGVVLLFTLLLAACSGGSSIDNAAAASTAPTAMSLASESGSPQATDGNSMVAPATEAAGNTMKAAETTKASSSATESDSLQATDGNAVMTPATKASDGAAMAAVETRQVAAQDSTPAANAQALEGLDPQAVVAAQEQVLTGIYERVVPSVVRIEVEQTQSWTYGFGPFGNAPNRSGGTPSVIGEGSGFVWSDEGYIVTNHHVIDRADQVIVTFADGTEVDAKVLGSDADSDLAVLKVDVPKSELHPVTLGDNSELKVGQLTLAIGNPFGQEFTMTSGIVSALGRTIKSGDAGFSIPKAVQTDAPINPGNSGGPLLDRLGRVIGINSQIISKSGGSAGIGFAIPINLAKQVVPELIENGRYEYAYLGIMVQGLRPRLAEANGLPRDTRGVLVVEVRDGGPAQASGLVGSRFNPYRDKYPTGGDVITAIDGTPVLTADDLIGYLVENNRPGDTVTLDLIRGNHQRVTVDVTLTARPVSNTFQAPPA